MKITYMANIADKAHVIHMAVKTYMEDMADKADLADLADMAGIADMAKTCQKNLPTMHILFKKFGQFQKRIFLYSCHSHFSSVYLKLHFALCTMICAHYSFLTAWVISRLKI